jgi:prepilin-type N-terminal cleavage/methylation domain-containing protein
MERPNHTDYREDRFLHFARRVRADHSEDPATSRRTPSPEAGFTLVEIAVTLMIIAILSTIALGEYHSYKERALMARCMNEMRSIQSTIFTHSNGGWPAPEESTFWDIAWSGVKPGPYFYMVDGDPNKGHGNDLDGIDEENPGKSGDNRNRRDIHFVVVCQHDHGSLGWYVYFEDEFRPHVATRDDNPGYHRFIKFIGGPGKSGGNGRGH